MKTANLERVLMALAFIAALISAIASFKQGFYAYAWQLISCVWISTNWMKTEQLNSLNKNK
jgi:hypothetical protein